MGKASRDEDLTMVVFRKLHSDMFSISRRAFPYVDSHVKDPSFDAADQLALGVRRSLEMKTAHHAIGRHRFVILHEVDPADLFFKFSLGERFEEISTGVVEDTGLDDYNPVYFRPYDFHLVQISSACTFKFVDDLEDVLAILVLEHRLCKLGHLLLRNPAHAVTDAFKTCYLETLTLLDGLHID